MTISGQGKIAVVIDVTPFQAPRETPFGRRTVRKNFALVESLKPLFNILYSLFLLIINLCKVDFSIIRK